MNIINIAELDFNAYVRSTAEGTPKPLVVMGFLSCAYNVPLNHVSLVGMTGTFKVKGLDHACQLTSEIVGYLAPVRLPYPAKAPKPQAKVQQVAQVAAQAVVKVATPQPTTPHLFDFLVGEAARVMDSTEEAILEALAPALPEPELGEILQEQKASKKRTMNKRKTITETLA